ncbi:hypothetical protein R3W88_030182 [Solanum pinnatisectum]|uniref:HMA domain-containing protein n=1 Tax=Solanum pinnatisectum TaxID=50273 RepID=A0AAV9KAZ3_9SOLN|nr:hypothetical protein R3W88_030182 [Solanum pinnatisectum]
MSSKQEGQKKKEEENVKVIFLINMNCVCKNCFKKIAKCTQKLEGIKSMEIKNTGVKYKVTVISKVESLKLQQKIEKKLKKKVEIISPKSKEKEIPKKTTLEINLGCDKCVEKMQNIVTKIKGFQGIFIDRSKNLVIVSGSINTEYLVKKLKKKLKKSVKIVKQEKYGDDLKPIWFPYYYNYWPESDQYIHEEAKYCRIM